MFGLAPKLDVTNIPGLAEYLSYSNSMADKYLQRQQKEVSLIKDETSFQSAGFCYVCSKKSTFHTDFLYADPNHVVDGQPIPNWRERVLCDQCHLNNRIRASIQFLEQKLKAQISHHIYITEQYTPLYAHLKSKYANLIGSEYLGETIPFGQTDGATGVRNESITRLTFQASSFDYILSFDVFEHVPEYTKALEECFRCLKNGGTLLFTVPFITNTETNLVRAKIDNAGKIEHILEPEYHGDPTSSEGCLCFYHFGWELLKQLREVGFTSVQAHFFWSDKLGYLGGDQLLFTARKPATMK